MTGAYAGILNGGSSVTPYGLVELKLKDEDTPLMGAGGGIGERVISEQAAQLLTYMMSQVIEGGTGARARLDGRPAAGKTGTTQAARDAWFIGFTADYVAGVWMGYDDNTPLAGVTGGGLPAEIWHEVMARITEGAPVNDLPMLVPEPRLPPQPDYTDPNMPDPAIQDPAYQDPAQPAQEIDPVEALLRDLLGENN
jgi:penicillin-binding protein 1A